MSQINKNTMNSYGAKYLANSKVEWLIENGKIHDVVYFKGETGDRYTIYVFTKRTKNIVDIHTVYNGYDHGTSAGSHVAVIKDYVLKIISHTDRYYHNDCGYILKQLIRQNVKPLSSRTIWKIRYCRSAYFMRLADGTEFSPWIGMKLNLRTGSLVNKPTRGSVMQYNKAKDTDRRARKANRIANKNNHEANARYLKADGNYALIPLDDVFKLRNTDRRNDIMNFHGLEKILAPLETKVEDEDTIDGRLYKLINVNIPDLASGQERHSWCLYLEMINPSTGESHFEGIANVDGNRAWGNNRIQEATVKAALSWRDGDSEVQTGDTWNSKATSDSYVKPIKLT